MIEWAWLAGGAASTILSAITGAQLGRLRAERRARDRTDQSLADARRSSEAELRRVRALGEERRAEVEVELGRLRRALLLGDAPRVALSERAHLEATLQRLGGLALVANAVVADELGLELARVVADGAEVDLAALALPFLALQDILGGVGALVSQTANGLHVETRAFPARPSGHASTSRRVLAVACKGQRPSPLALDAMFAYAESSDPAAAPWRLDPAPVRDSTYVHHEPTDAARALALELDGFRASGALLTLAIVDGGRLLCAASSGGLPLERLQRLARALPELVATTSRRARSPWSRSDVLMPDGSTFAIRRVSPAGRFFLVTQSDRPISDLELDRIGGRLRRLTNGRPGAGAVAATGAA